jgi:hypothetical protein
VQRAGQVYANVVKTDFPARAEAIAELLAANPPDLAGLQEVALWEIGPIGGPLSPSYDFLQLLLDALARHGLVYRPVAVNLNFSGEAPIGATTAARFTDRDVEAFSTPVRNAQGHELAAALATFTHPVVLVGDLNSRPDDTAGAYGTFSGAGYADAWTVVHGRNGGFTSGQSELLDNVPSLLDHRIDYVLYQPRAVEALEADVIGDELNDRTFSGLWPSDHAGVVATLHLARP